MDKKGLVLISLDEIQRCIGQLVGVVVALFCRQFFIVSITKRIVIGTHPSRDLLIETVGLRVHAHMRFAVVCGGVTIVLEGLGQSDFLGW